MRKSVKSFSIFFVIATFVIVSASFVAPGFLSTAKVFGFGTPSTGNNDGSDNLAATGPDEVAVAKLCSNTAGPCKDKAIGSSCTSAGGVTGTCQTSSDTDTNCGCSPA